MSEAWIAFTGVIVGSVISAGFTWFIEWRKSKSEERIRLKQEGDEALCQIIQIFFSKEDVFFKFFSIQPLLPKTASKRILDENKKILDNFFNRNQNLLAKRINMSPKQTDITSDFALEEDIISLFKELIYEKTSTLNGG